MESVHLLGLASTEAGSSHRFLYIYKLTPNYWVFLHDFYLNEGESTLPAFGTDGILEILLSRIQRF